MKLALSLMLSVFLTSGAFANTLIWSCSHNGNPNAVTVSYGGPNAQMKSIVTINDADIMRHLSVPYAGSNPPRVPYTITAEADPTFGSFKALTGEYAGGFQFTLVNGGVNLYPVAMGNTYETDYPQYNYFFPNGECIRH